MISSPEHPKGQTQAIGYSKALYLLIDAIRNILLFKAMDRKSVKPLREPID